MKILAIDTSTEACSTALYVNGELIERFTLAPKKHIEILLPMVKEVLAESEIGLSNLDGLAFSAGPGSFAGLRVSCAFMQGLASGLSLPIVPVSTLATMALQVLEEQPDSLILTALDAKMNEVYWGAYKQDERGIMALTPDQVLPVDQLPDFSAYKDHVLIGAGEGWKRLESWKEALQPAAMMMTTYPRAGEVALLAVKDLEKGLGLFADQVAPMYLRNDIALTLVEQEALRAGKMD